MTRLTRREKLLAVISAICVLVWMLFTYAIKPTIARVETLNRVIHKKQEELEELRAKSKEYIFLRDSLEDLRMRMASQDRAFELLPFLESLIRQSGLDKKVTTIKQQVLQLDPNCYETIVEIKLENLTIGQIVDFLQKIEGLPQRQGPSELLTQIKSLYVTSNLTNPDLLDLVVEIFNPKLIEN